MTIGASVRKSVYSLALCDFCFSVLLVKPSFPHPLNSEGNCWPLRNGAIQSQCFQYPEPWTSECQGTYSSLYSSPPFSACFPGSPSGLGHGLRSCPTRAPRCTEKDTGNEVMNRGKEEASSEIPSNEGRKMSILRANSHRTVGTH